MKFELYCKFCIFLHKGGKCMINNVMTKLEDLNLVDRFLFDEVMEDMESNVARRDPSQMGGFLVTYARISVLHYIL